MTKSKNTIKIQKDRMTKGFTLRNEVTKGQSLVELILAVALASILLPALLTGLVSSREGKAQQDNRFTATAYLKEAVEAVRIVREAGWSGIATNGTYYPPR